jgi:hypothetical protein
MLPGVTTAALVGMWLAAGLTFYTGYAYLQAGLSHAKRELRPSLVESEDEAPAMPARRDRRQRHA